MVPCSCGGVHPGEGVALQVGQAGSLREDLHQGRHPSAFKGVCVCLRVCGKVKYSHLDRYINAAFSDSLLATEVPFIVLFTSGGDFFPAKQCEFYMHKSCIEFLETPCMITRLAQVPQLAQHRRNVSLAFLLNELLEKPVGVCI